MADPKYAQQPYGQQPMATPGMVVAPGGGQRNAKNLPYDANGQRDWSNGLCSFFGDCSTCCVSAFCPCIIYSQNKTRKEHLERQGYPHPDGGESCGNDCFLHCLLTGCVGFGWILQIPVRAAIRDRYRISGTSLGDCCSIYCCLPCALTQESRELELEERSMIPAGGKA